MKRTHKRFGRQLGMRPPWTGMGGFSLVELLVVVAIIGILGALTIPVVSSVFQTADRVQCASNQRQIGSALLLYATENNGSFPQSTHSLSSFRRDQSWIFAISDYLGNIDEIRLCPADPPERQKQILDRNATSYALNDQVFDHPRYNNIQRIPDPANTMLMFILAEHLTPSVTRDHVHGGEWITWQAVLNDIEPDRHRSGGRSPARTKGSANYLFADGRVENIDAATFKRILESGKNPAAVPSH